MVNSLADIAEALQLLAPEEMAPFLAWAESEEGAWWLPGYGGADWSIHPPEDAVLWFRCSAAADAGAAAPCAPRPDASPFAAGYRWCPA